MTWEESPHHQLLAKGSWLFEASRKSNVLSLDRSGPRLLFTHAYSARLPLKDLIASVVKARRDLHGLNGRLSPGEKRHLQIRYVADPNASPDSSPSEPRDYSVLVEEYNQPVGSLQGRRAFTLGDL